MTPYIKAEIEIDNNVVPKFPSSNLWVVLFQSAPQVFINEYQWHHKHSAD